MIALIAGRGDLPSALLERLAARGQVPLVRALEGNAPDLPPDVPVRSFRLETLGTLIEELRAAGVDRLCMAGAIDRPALDPARIDAATAPLVPRLAGALGAGDDGALRAVIAVFEEAGLTILAAHEIAPDLLVSPGRQGAAMPGPEAEADIEAGLACLVEMGAADSGQACLVRDGTVIAREDAAGTDAMLAAAGEVPGAVLVKGPKPGQDRRVDLPVIGPGTARGAVRARLAGIAVVAGGTMLLRREEALAVLDASGLWLVAQEP
ncbi:LpxI family protein [Wenxinia saemankumensis]|uniref:Phosphatidate cytidylyltransferase n=1 Tax=Wenxinia saemankumensis TaxID=1447782 RepID=A0A1M6A0T7_9RHOB|nr:UDP-2,3-diacylglucosamine diphosphatase LpxI [Wenxinia saemankumensis]SHI30080.1 hypothetical protein SAMN05444417_0137 [Wenxinia saemankumensis]